MLSSYIPIALFVVIATGFALFTLVFSSLIHSEKYNKVKLEPYECGVPATSHAFDHRFSVRYFLIAVLFIIFDVETVFLFPWAIRFKQLGWFGAVEMAVFLAILLIGYFYAWKRKVLSWV
jgi:NADH-quinone oxidoreductase subunit A